MAFRTAVRKPCRHPGTQKRGEPNRPTSSIILFHFQYLKRLCGNLRTALIQKLIHKISGSNTYRQRHDIHDYQPHSIQAFPVSVQQHAHHIVGYQMHQKARLNTMCLRTLPLKHTEYTNSAYTLQEILLSPGLLRKVPNIIVIEYSFFHLHFLPESVPPSPPGPLSAALPGIPPGRGWFYEHFLP